MKLVNAKDVFFLFILDIVVYLALNGALLHGNAPRSDKFFICTVEYFVS